MLHDLMTVSRTHLVIFTGLKEKMEETIFKIKPELRYRFTWKFELEYDMANSADVFLKSMPHILDPSMTKTDLIELVDRKGNNFRNPVIDVKQWAYFTDVVYSIEKLRDWNKLVTRETIESGLNLWRAHRG